MFHANAWGIPYGCAMTGTKIVMPGARMEGDMIFEMLETEDVTFAAGVPTVLDATARRDEETGAKAALAENPCWLAARRCPEP